MHLCAMLCIEHMHACIYSVSLENNKLITPTDMKVINEFPKALINFLYNYAFVLHTKPLMYVGVHVHSMHQLAKRRESNRGRERGSQKNPYTWRQNLSVATSFCWSHRERCCAKGWLAVCILSTPWHSYALHTYMYMHVHTCTACMYMYIHAYYIHVYTCIRS